VAEALENIMTDTQTAPLGPSCIRIKFQISDERRGVGDYIVEELPEMLNMLERSF
jgi:hypothetical protein